MRTTTGTVERARRRARTSSPSIPGSDKSRRYRSGTPTSPSASASSPVLASCTSKPETNRVAASVDRKGRSSSTSITVGRAGPPDIGVAPAVMPRPRVALARRKRLPPRARVTVIEPPWASQIARAIVRPSPVPAEPPRTNSSKMRPWSAGRTPGPSSTTRSVAIAFDARPEFESSNRTIDITSVWDGANRSAALE